MPARTGSRPTPRACGCARTNSWPSYAVSSPAGCSARTANSSSPPRRDQLREAFAQIATRRKTIEGQLAAITKPPEAANRHDPALLDRLPVVEGDLSHLPDELERDLWERFHLQVRYHHPTRRITIRATIDEDTVQHLTTAHPTIMTHVRRAWPDRPPKAGAAGRRRRVPCFECPRWDSNPHCRRFELRSSAGWDTGTGTSHQSTDYSDRGGNRHPHIEVDRSVASG
jgi:hypothetical protein